jgi:hypothetical protein
MPICKSTWLTMVGTINASNLLNYINVKLVNVLNNHGVGHTIMNTSQTLTPRSINWFAPSSNSLALNTWNELARTITRAKTLFFSYPCAQTIVPRSHHHMRKMSLNHLLKLENHDLKMRPWSPYGNTFQEWNEKK